jgi:hypothetical protein
MKSAWTVLTLAVLIVVVRIIGGVWKSSDILGVVALVLLGALFPPAGILVGGIALLRLFVTTNGSSPGRSVLSGNLSGAWSSIRTTLYSAFGWSGTSSASSPPAGGATSTTNGSNGAAPQGV